MKVIWAILCEKAVTDQDSNNVSLINIIEEVTLVAEPPEIAGQENHVEDSEEAEDTLRDPPLMRLPGELVILWARSHVEEGEVGSGRIHIIPPKGRERHSLPHTIDLTHFLRLRLRAFLPGIPMEGPGMYLIQIESRCDNAPWEVNFELPLRVAVQSPESN